MCGARKTGAVLKSDHVVGRLDGHFGEEKVSGEAEENSVIILCPYEVGSRVECFRKMQPTFIRNSSLNDKI